MKKLIKIVLTITAIINIIWLTFINISIYKSGTNLAKKYDFDYVYTTKEVKSPTSFYSDEALKGRYVQKTHFTYYYKDSDQLVRFYSEPDFANEYVDMVWRQNLHKEGFMMFNVLVLIFSFAMTVYSFGRTVRYNKFGLVTFCILSFMSVLTKPFLSVPTYIVYVTLSILALISISRLHYVDYNEKWTRWF